MSIHAQELFGYKTPVVQGSDVVIPLCLSSGLLALRVSKATLAALVIELERAAGATMIQGRPLQSAIYQDVYKDWCSGGISKEEACARHGVKYHAFRQWLWRHKKKKRRANLRMCEYDGRWVSRIWYARHVKQSEAA